MRTPIAGITLATVLALAGPVVAADTWVLWEQQIRGRPRAVDTFDDKAACVAGSRTAAEREAEGQRAVFGGRQVLQYAVVPGDNGTVLQAGDSRATITAAVYRCWPVGVNP